MPGRRRVLTAAMGSLAVSLTGCLGDDESDASTGTDSPAPGGSQGTGGGSLAVTSSAFADGGTIPQVYTHDGEDRSPPLSVSGVPDAADTLALVVDDPDAGSEPFVHWLCWNVPADVTSIPAGIDQVRRVDALGGARQGTNDFGELGYLGPRPPPADGPHTYRFTLSAVDGSLNVQAGARAWAVRDGLAAAELSSATLTGEYDR